MCEELWKFGFKDVRGALQHRCAWADAHVNKEKWEYLTFFLQPCLLALLSIANRADVSAGHGGMFPYFQQDKLPLCVTICRRLFRVAIVQIRIKGAGFCVPEMLLLILRVCFEYSFGYRTEADPRSARPASTLRWFITRLKKSHCINFTFTLQLCKWPI